MVVTLNPVIVVHGGAWAIPDDLVEPHRAGVRKAALEGWKVLNSGGSALDAVEAAVKVMEDDPTFDAGVGSFLNQEGMVELDAAIMDGTNLSAGAVGSVNRVRHPVSLARAVMEHTEHVLMMGEGAHKLAERLGLEMCDPSFFVTERELARWREAKEKGFSPRQAFAKDSTVGAVAVDSQGRFAAALSTGGVPNKLPGRVGDVPLIGCGLYADGLKGAVACTGLGESIIRVVLAKSTVDLLGAGLSAQAAAQAAVDLLRRVDGYGGVIVLDRSGRVGYAYNTPRMAVAYVKDGEVWASV